MTREVPVPVPGSTGDGTLIWSQPQQATITRYQTWTDGAWNTEQQGDISATELGADAESVLYDARTATAPADATHYAIYNNTTVYWLQQQGDTYYVIRNGVVSSDNYAGEGVVACTPGQNITYGGTTYNVPTNAEPRPTHYRVVDGQITWYHVQQGQEASGGWDYDKVYDCVELTSNEVYVIEAGAYLAYKPDTDHVNTTLGNKAIAFKEPTGATATQYFRTNDGGTTWEPVGEADYNVGIANEATASQYKKVEGSNGNEDPTNYGKTDFTPHGDGLYVFRRAIVVAPGDNKPGSSVAAGTETFEYEGYYFLGGKYYKIMNLVVNPDGQFDVAADGITSDGQLDSASACLVREEKQYGLKPERFTYDAANNRIIASYDTNTENTLLKSDYESLAKQLDTAEHDLAEAELLLQRALTDADIVNDSVKDKTKDVDAAQLAYNQALAAYEKAKAEFEEARTAYLSGKNAFTPAQQAAVTAFTNLVGANGVVSDNAKVTGKSDAANPAKTGDTWTADTSTLKNGDATLIADADSPVAAYGAAKKAFWDWVQRNVAVSSDPASSQSDHIAFVFLKELAKDAAANPIDEGNYYKLPTGWENITDASQISEDELVAQLKEAVQKVTYQYAANVAERIFADNPSTTGTYDNTETHKFHQLLAALRTAEKNYNDALTAYNTAIGNLNKAIEDLGELGNFEKFADTDEVTKAKIEALDAWKSQKAANVRTTYDTLGGTAIAADNNEEKNYTEYDVPTEAGIQAWTQAVAGTNSQPDKAERKLWEAWQALKNAQAALKAVEDKTYIDLEQQREGANNTNYGLPYGGPNYVKAQTGEPQDDEGYKLDENGNRIIDDTLVTSVDNNKVATNLEAAWANYYNKRNAVDELGRKLKAAQNAFYNDGALNVYIYLKNVTLTGNEAKKWQLLPTDLADKKATFYYTSILAAGEVSEQLIDYVELDERTTKEMYKYFDFDLNVTLDSAQVGFDENGARNAEPANEAFDWVETNKKSHDVTGMIKNPTVAPTDGTSNGTVVTWSENTVDAPADTVTEQYTPVSMIPQNANPSANGWYEFINGKYVETDDTIVDWSKTYYTNGSNSGQQGISATFRDTPVTLMPSTASGKFGATDGDDITFAYEFAMNGQTYYVKNTTGSPILVYVLSTSGNCYVFPTGDNVLQLA